MSEGEDEEDWSKYASAGFGAAYDPWADLVPLDEQAIDEDEIDLGDDGFHYSQPPPSDDGFDQLVRMGACNFCIARLSGEAHPPNNLETRGAELRAKVEERGVSTDEEVDYCPFCEDLFADIPLVSDIITNELEGLEFKRLQLASHFAKTHVMSEDELRGRYGATGCQALKSAYNESLAATISSLFKEVKIVKEEPEVMVLVDTLTLKPKTEIRSLYLYGRYRKLERGIPQTRWPCRVCKGRKEGCEECDGSGQQYPTNVQDQIGEPLRAAFQAQDTAFHGMGREDIDVRCLGRGRPFVIEMKSPMRRYADLSEMTELVNATSSGRVEISELRPSRRSEVARIKGTAAEKSYTIRFKIGPELHNPPTNGSKPHSKKSRTGKKRRGKSRRAESDENEDGDSNKPLEEDASSKASSEKTDAEDSTTIEKIEAQPVAPPEWTDEQVIDHITSLEGVTLAQQTPQRVAHRRADKIRKRDVVSISSVVVEGDEAEMDVRVESGTYVKELVHSDEGRTTPSVAEKLGLKCEVIWLDVNDVHAD